MINDNNENIKLVEKIAKDIKEKNGRIFYVGGYVRDKILNIESKDIDTEIFGIYPDTLKQILSKYGIVDEFGLSFGIYKIKGYDIDFAMPRKEIKTGSLHTDFEINIDPNISYHMAAKRRDFTINSIMQDVLTNEIIDNFNGVQDIKNGIIRHIADSTFIEDSLRALRACQFAARFNFKIADDTIDICKNLDYSNIPKQRVYIELEKALLKSNKPSIFFYNLQKMNILGRFFLPLDQTVGIKQNPIYHPEGDVFTHTMLVLDNVSLYKEKSNYPIALMLAAICHDLGKITTTEFNNGKIISYGHESKLELIDKLLKNITDNKDLISSVKLLVKNHMRPNVLVSTNVSDKAIRKLIVDSHGKKVNIYDLILLAKADRMEKQVGSIELKDDDFAEKWWYDKIEKVNRKEAKIEPIVNGIDLINLGLKQGKDIGNALKYGFDLQIEGLKKQEILEKIKEKFQNI